MAEVVIYDKDTGRIEYRSRGKVNPDLFQLNYPEKGVIYSEGNTDWAASHVRIAEGGKAEFLRGLPRLSKEETTGFIKHFTCELLPIPDPKVKAGVQPELAVFRPIGIGDVILSLPALFQLRQKYPEWYITYWTTPQGARVLAGLPWLDKIGMVRYEKTKALHPQIPTEIEKFDHAINWAGQVDFGEETWGRARVDMFCEHAEVDPPNSFDFPPLKITPDQKHWAELTLLANGAEMGKQKIVAAVLNSHGESRRWDWKKWVELAERLPDVQFLWLSDSPAHAIPAPSSNVINTANQLFFEEYLALLSVCDLIVCPDTSAYHLGEMLRIPSVVLEGSVELKTRTKYYKYTNGVRLRQKLPCQPCHDFQVRRDCYGKDGMPWCLSKLSSSRVARKIKKLL